MGPPQYQTINNEPKVDNESSNLWTLMVIGIPLFVFLFSLMCNQRTLDEVREAGCNEDGIKLYDLLYIASATDRDSFSAELDKYLSNLRRDLDEFVRRTLLMRTIETGKDGDLMPSKEFRKVSMSYK